MCAAAVEGAGARVGGLGGPGANGELGAAAPAGATGAALAAVAALAGPAAPWPAGLAPRSAGPWGCSCSSGTAARNRSAACEILEAKHKGQLLRSRTFQPISWSQHKGLYFFSIFEINRLKLRV